jgi:hypothetical protein
MQFLGVDVNKMIWLKQVYKEVLVDDGHGKTVTNENA